MSGRPPLRVVELSNGIAAAYCGKLLADAGAEVTVVEPAGGHPLRHRRPAPGASPGALYSFLSGPKRTCRTGPGDPATDALIDGADVVILDERSGPPGPGRAGPVQVSFSPFGLDGPWRDRPWTEFTLQAMSGSTGKRGLPGRPPVCSGGAPVEFVAGSYGAAAAMCFAWSAPDEPAGVHLDVSLLEAGAVTMHAFMTIDAGFRAARERPPRRSQIPSIEPTADGYIGFSTITAQQFTDFLHMIERPDLAADETLLQPEERQRRRHEVVSAIRAWTAGRPTEEILDVATAYRIPVAPIGNGANLPERDHMVERGVYSRGPGRTVAPRRPYSITAAPPGRAGTGRRSPWRGPARGAPGDRPLAGLRVADLTAFWAGPAATHVLAALGADVIKVESTGRPDGMRFTSARPTDERWLEWSPVFHGVNANKRSLALDLRSPAGARTARELVRWADVVIENFSPRVLDEVGLGFPAIGELNPAAVLVRMPAFGLTGPWRDRTGFAMTVEQASGMAWQTGYEDGPPMDVGGVCDPLGGMHAVVALMAALRQRLGTGRGALVEVPLVEVALNVAAEQVVQYAADGTLLARRSNHGPDGCPQGVYPVQGIDRWIALSVRTDSEWSALVALMGHPSWARVADLACRSGREAAADLIDRHLGQWCSAHAGPALVDRLVEAGIPAATVVVPAEVADNPQLTARGFFEPLSHPVVGDHRIPSLPFRVVGRSEGWYRTAAPVVGQHTAEVERQLDLQGGST